LGINLSGVSLVLRVATGAIIEAIVRFMSAMSPLSGEKQT